MKNKLYVLVLMLMFVFAFTATVSAAEITVYIEQPVPGSRDIVGKDFSQGIKVGTTWIVVNDTKQFTANFIPAKNLVTFKEGGLLVHFEDLPGKVLMGEESEMYVKNLSWHGALKFDITSEQARRAVSFIQNYNKPYNLANHNCVNFAVDVLKEIGLETDKYFKKHEIIAPQYYHSLLKSLGIDPEKVFISYTPGNTVEDWREIKDFRINVENDF